MCEYDVDCAEVADLRDEKGRKRHGVELVDLACGWLTCLRDRREAPSWLVADKLRNEDFCGILVPSFAPGAPASHHNLVLWRSEEHTSELQSLMRISYTVFCLKKKNNNINSNLNMYTHITSET